MKNNGKGNFKNLIHPEKPIIDEIIRINMNRTFYLSLISIPMRIYTIILFLNKTTVEGKETLWKNGIILNHSIYLFLLMLLCVLSFQLRKIEKVGIWSIAVKYTMICTILIFGAIITSIDQLVTYSIIPFLISCIAVGIIFLIKPSHSIIFYLLAYIVYYISMGISQKEVSILLSNRINGFTSVTLGFFISFLMWRANVLNLQQRNHIQYQQRELEKKNEELNRLATFDHLTGLVNRRHFEERIANEIARIKRQGGKSCLLIIDIDDFKGINDKFGHPTGDSLLKEFSSLLTDQLREIDIIARVGGEEFAIILVGADKDIGKNIAQRIRENIEKHIFIIEEAEIAITISIGISLLDNGLNSHGEGYKLADRALYNAKTKGKNRIEMELKEG